MKKQTGDPAQTARKEIQELLPDTSVVGYGVSIFIMKFIRDAISEMCLDKEPEEIKRMLQEPEFLTKLMETKIMEGKDEGTLKEMLDGALGDWNSEVSTEQILRIGVVGAVKELARWYKIGLGLRIEDTIIYSALNQDEMSTEENEITEAREEELYKFIEETKLTPEQKEFLRKVVQYNFRGVNGEEIVDPNMQEKTRKILGEVNLEGLTEGEKKFFIEGYIEEKIRGNILGEDGNVLGEDENVREEKRQQTGQNR